jgi:hypothetical protein
MDGHAEKRDRHVIHVGLHHGQHEPAPGAQRPTQPHQRIGNQGPRQHQQREERHHGIEDAELRVHVRDVQRPEVRLRHMRPGHVQHHRGDVDTGDVRAGLDQLAGRGQPGTATRVKHPCALPQALDHPLPGGDLPLLVREGLVVALPDEVEGGRLGLPAISAQRGLNLVRHQPRPSLDVSGGPRCQPPPPAWILGGPINKGLRPGADLGNRCRPAVRHPGRPKRRPAGAAEVSMLGRRPEATSAGDS